MALKPSKPISCAARLRQLFEAHPHTWIAQQEIAAVAGIGGFRSRISDELRGRWRMDIRNETRSVKVGDGHYIKQSFYQYVPEGSR